MGLQAAHRRHIQCLVHLLRPAQLLVQYLFAHRPWHQGTASADLLAPVLHRLTVDEGLQRRIGNMVSGQWVEAEGFGIGQGLIFGWKINAQALIQVKPGGVAKKLLKLM